MSNYNVARVVDPRTLSSPTKNEYKSLVDEATKTVSKLSFWNTAGLVGMGLSGKIDDGPWHVFRSDALSSAPLDCPEDLARSKWETNTGLGGFYVGSIETLA